ncbi:MAG TPA: TIGR03619 family F420-dependent LLM class oxidoreductase [Methylomirabilota bacterium]|nr:TIGR03619 family F420-dependent LLM class oxidoreductase [Methylomirabilota bacterium]
MEIGCHLPTTLGPDAVRDGLVTFAREAEKRQVASLWVSDHVVIPHAREGYPMGGRFPVAPEVPYLEPVTALAAVAMCTTRARLGCSVFILGHRHPVVMAKMLASLDALTAGRLICGVGVGWWQHELEVLGVPFHARGRQADEILRVFKELWTAERPAFDGEFFRFRDIGFAPKPLQKPHPPIWVGGASPGAYRRVVMLGDGWHAMSRTPADFEKQRDELRAAAEAAKRDFGTIELSLRFNLDEPLLAKGAQAVIDRFGEYKRLGVQHVAVVFRREDLGRMLEILDLVTGTIRPAVDRA